MHNSFSLVEANINISNYQWDDVIALIFFKEKMNELFNGIAHIRVYIDDLLIISNGNLVK